MSNKNIYAELQEGNLIEAFLQLQIKVDKIGNWQLQQDLEQIRTTYSTMLSYMTKGIQDPEAERIRQNLIQQGYAINDRANLAISLKKNPSTQYNQTYTVQTAENTDLEHLIRELELASETLHQMHDHPNRRESIQNHDLTNAISHHDRLTESLFKYTWVSGLWTNSIYDIYANLLNNEIIPLADKSATLGATVLACYELFDPQKIMLLFDAYLSNDIEISQRALVGLIIIIIRYDSRLKHYPQITSRFQFYSENQQFVDDCFRILMQLQYSKITDSVSDKMINDIMPAILKSKKFNNTDTTLTDSELTRNGENPEWIQNSKADKKAEKKIRQMSEMQTDGADVYLSAFAMLKGFPFFQKFHHWFCPFSFDYPETFALTSTIPSETLSIIRKLFSISPFCDNDKFSFLFMVDNVKHMGQEAIISQIESQMEGESFNDMFAARKKDKREAKDVSRTFIFDLYRVFKCYPYHTQLFDPFSKALSDFSPLHFATLSPLADHYDETLSLAEFMMRRGEYSEAIKLFQYLNPKNREEDSDIWQKIGFCLQKTNHTQSALEVYEKANSLNPDSKWTIQHIVQTAFDIKAYDKALRAIDILLADDEDNVKWLEKKAECMFGLNLYEEALPTLYKLAYINETSELSQEMLAWGLIMSGNIAKAFKIHQDMLKNNPSVRNLILTAHLIMIDGNIQEAYAHYAQAYLAADSEEIFSSIFWEWKSFMPQIGMNGQQMQMMFDAVRIISTQ